MFFHLLSDVLKFFHLKSVTYSLISTFVFSVLFLLFPRAIFAQFFFFNVYFKKYELGFPSIPPPEVTSAVMRVSGVCVCFRHHEP